MPQIPKQYIFKILGIPKPKQSFSFTKTGIKYSNTKVLALEANFRAQIISILKKDYKGFVPLDGPLKVSYTFVFPPPKSLGKKLLTIIEEGGIVWKETRPDMPDNLKKGCNDAMNGVVFSDDARICKDSGCKYYGKTPHTEVVVEELPRYVRKK